MARYLYMNENWKTAWGTEPRPPKEFVDGYGVLIVNIDELTEVGGEPIPHVADFLQAKKEQEERRDREWKEYLDEINGVK